MFYRGQLCELNFHILDHKQCRRPPPHISHQIYATDRRSLRSVMNLTN